MAAMARGLDAPPRPGRGAGRSPRPLQATAPLSPAHAHVAAGRGGGRGAQHSPEPEPEPQPQLHRAERSPPATQAHRRPANTGALCCGKPPQGVPTSIQAGRSPRGRASSPTARHDVRKPLLGTVQKFCKGSYVSSWQPRELELVPETGVLLVRDPTKDDDAPLEAMAHQLTGASIDPLLAKLNDDTGNIVRYGGHPVTAATLNGTAYEGTHPLRLNSTRLWQLHGAAVEQERMGQHSVLVVTPYAGGQQLRISTPHQPDLRRWKQSLRFAAGGGERPLSAVSAASALLCCLCSALLCCLSASL